ncbi:MAG: hypothetical protein LBT47_07850 [Deltaproteobacteria bacterium]|nr:hypothetical protein [Deltaproteobacteria bacterium]
MNDISEKKFYRSLSALIRPGQILKSGGWPAVFGRRAPLEMEIGFGNGEYLARASQAAPERDFVGVELAWNSLKRALRRLNAPPRNNVKLLHLPVKSALRYLFEPQSLSAVRVFFPVPWPNEKQSSKRIFSTIFFNLLADRLTADGIFHLVTDHQGLALWTKEQARDSAIELDYAEHQALLDTKYERKWLSSGQEVFYHLSGRQKNHPKTQSPLELYDMSPRYSQLIDPQNYHPCDLSGEPTVVFGDFLFDDTRQEGLLRTKVVEDHFIQEFHIKISRQSDRRFKLCCALNDQVLPTRGVALAIALAALEEPSS